MARNIKNSRRITVDDIEYRWRASGGDGYITLMVWPVNNIGPTIQGNFKYHETWLPQAEGRWLSAGDQIIITNRIVRRIIKLAVTEQTYNPLEKGRALDLRQVDNQIDISDAVRATDPNREF